MTNLEKKLTVDDLIVEYMICKVENGYEPKFSASEFLNFLYFFESKMEVEDSLYESKALFDRFFERKFGSDWQPSVVDNKIQPHMEIQYSEKDNDYIISANYRLSYYDRSVLNTHFMDNMPKNNSDRVTVKIRSLIGEYLSNQPKRKIDKTIQTDEKDLIVGKYVSAEIIAQIWFSYISKQVKYYKWPKQCSDINKYLFEMDLAEIIGVPSIKDRLVELYDVFSKRIAILYHQDNNLKVSSYLNEYLARSNYELLIEGYEETLGIAFGPSKKSFSFDLSSISFNNSNVVSTTYDLDDDFYAGYSSNLVGTDKVKKIIRNLDKSMNK